jgi:hypothetical protein
MLEDQIKNPDRFKKEEPKNNLLTIEDFSKTLNPFINKLIEHDKRVGKVEKVGNQLLSDLKYSEADFIGNFKSSKLQEIPDDDIDETNNKYYNSNDGNGIITDNPDNYYEDQGNSNPYIEIEQNKTPQRTSHYNNDINNTPQQKSHDNDMNNTPKSKSIIDTTQQTLSKFFNINKKSEDFNKADENFVSPQPDEKEKIKSTQKETIKSTQNDEYVYDIQPTDALQNDKTIAIPRYKNLLFQFGKTPDELDKKLKLMNMNDIRTEYQKYYAEAKIHNEKIHNEKNIKSNPI